jgi:hypothetical protein
MDATKPVYGKMSKKEQIKHASLKDCLKILQDGSLLEAESDNTPGVYGLDYSLLSALSCRIGELFVEQKEKELRLLTVLELLDGFLENKGYSEYDPLVRGAIKKEVPSSSNLAPHIRDCAPIQFCNSYRK